MQRRSVGATLAAAVFAIFVTCQPSRAADDTIRIGFIAPFSGPLAEGTDKDVRALEYILDYVNAHEAPLGKKFELVTFDHKMHLADALVALRRAIDQNIPVVLQLGLSHIAAALIDAVAKNNQGNPDHRVIYLNGTQATELTNQKCNFWHFRFGSSVEQRAYARIKSIPADVKKVYLLNQDYLYGHSIEQDTRRFLYDLRPDIEIVGDEFIPLLEVKDFSSYASKIKQSGAQSLVTGNFGPDLNLLLKAGLDAGLNIRYDAYLSDLTGIVAAIGAAGRTG
jgi:branched-chain amino acid transport system substrate-binding protein